jgi:hypothetical protein
VADRLAEIRKREQAATKGPWEPVADYGPNFYAYLGGSYLEGIGTLNFGEGSQAEADLTFTLNARTDVPFLLAEVARLQGEVDTLAAENTVLERALGLNEGAAA